jgi:alkanesulfonate monooxygenase SsuD/methylene tetrahydromethanopterin reductase-like flavin-dependent oxidoreductase (luciferase family)
VKVGLALGDLATIAADAAAAETAGFDYVACGEHVFFHGPTPNALIGLATAAGATREIRLVTTVALAAQYPAALFTKLVTSLDVASGGRLELGIGAGGEYPPEWEAVGVDPSTRFRRVDETMEVLRLLWDGAPVDFDGAFTRLPGVRLQPVPTQRRGPPIWMAGRKAVGLRRVARWADVWLPYMITPEKMQTGLAQIRAAADELGRPDETVTGAVYAWTCCDPDGDWARRTGTEVVSRIYAQDFAPLAGRYLLLGTPDEVVGRLREFAEAGAARVIISVAARPDDHQRVVRTLVDEVLPALRPL